VVWAENAASLILFAWRYSLALSSRINEGLASDQEFQFAFTIGSFHEASYIVFGELLALCFRAEGTVVAPN